MRLETLTLHNFKSYQDAELDLSNVALASVVGANGSGKSSLLEAVVFALTGARGLRNLDSFIRQGEEECRASLTFTMGAERFRITRTRSSRGSGKSTVELAREENDLWAAEGTGARDTDARIGEILAVDEDILLLTSIVAQGDAGSFFALRPAQRLEAFAAILKLDEQYGPLERCFKAQAEEAKAGLEENRREVVRLESDLATLNSREGDLADDQQRLDRAKKEQAAAEGDLGRAQESAEAAKEAVREAEEAKRRLEELERRHSGLAGRETDLLREKESLLRRVEGRPELERTLKSRPDIEAQLAALAEAERADAHARQRRAVLEADLRARTQAVQETAAQGKPKAAELERLKTSATDLNDRVCVIRGAVTPVCDRCGQPIADQALTRTLTQLEGELEQVSARRDALGEEVESLRAKLAAQKAEAEKTKDEIATLPPLTYDPAEEKRLAAGLEQLNEIPAKLAEIFVCEERLAAVAGELETVKRDLADPELVTGLREARDRSAEADETARTWIAAGLEVQKAQGCIDVLAREISELEKTIARHQEAIRILGPSRDQLAACQRRCRELEEAQADAELLRKAFSKWGIPALIVGSVLAALEREVNELLALYDGGLAVRFESERETANGTRDSLEILVYDGRDWRPYETFSGGEKYRVASAMRLGLALLLAHRSGARVETLIVDEPEGLDVEGRQHLARILEHLSDHFGLVLLLTHYEDLKEAMPSQILVSRDGDGLSRVEVMA
ncbi:MAG: SMC family ATPase [Spirochaetales bacterium]|nr:SMC family ATPase [Spirochaetales bacterium]